MSSYSRFSINLALNAFKITLNTELSANENRNLVNDSRLIAEGDIFAATVGHLCDGRDYIDNAIKAGAELIIVQCDNISDHGKIEVRKTQQSEGSKTVTLVSFFELNKHLSRLANLYYHQPHNRLTSIGVTGTNGKTTTSQIIAQLLDYCGKSCAVIGTTGAGKLNELQPVINTTPGPTELNKLLSDFVNDGMSHVAMEISSHALEQRRILPSLIDIAVFTNLTRDHLDYHQTMDNYAAAKEKLFAKNSAQIAILNGDDSCAKGWLKTWASESQIIVYGLNQEIKNNPAFVYGSDIKHTAQGIEFLLETHSGNALINTVLMGDFNISNILASAAVLLSQGFSLDKIAKAISQLKPVVGRMEIFAVPSLATSVVDYAHTPDALENALKACKAHCCGRLYVVFGCGGDRDQGKRALMGTVAEQNADYVILTNDNPRNESPQAIVDEILTGFKQPDKVKVILSREEAVLKTIKACTALDMILFAGKGHEDYLVMGNEKIPYNEREFVKSIYANEVGS